MRPTAALSFLAQRSFKATPCSFVEEIQTLTTLLSFEVMFRPRNKVPEHCLKLATWQGPPHVNKAKQCKLFQINAELLRLSHCSVCGWVLWANQTSQKHNKIKMCPEKWPAVLNHKNSKWHKEHLMHKLSVIINVCFCHRGPLKNELLNQTSWHFKQGERCFFLREDRGSPQTPAIKQLTLKMSTAAQRRCSTVWREPRIQHVLYRWM